MLNITTDPNSFMFFFSVQYTPQDARHIKKGSIGRRYLGIPSKTIIPIMKAISKKYTRFRFILSPEIPVRIPINANINIMPKNILYFEPNEKGYQYPSNG